MFNIDAANFKQFNYLIDISSQRRREVLQHLAPSHRGKWVAVDLETGEYELADDPRAAERKLVARLPRAAAWMFEVRADWRNDG